MPGKLKQLDPVSAAAVEPQAKKVKASKKRSKDVEEVLDAGFPSTDSPAKKKQKSAPGEKKKKKTKKSDADEVVNVADEVEACEPAAKGDQGEHGAKAFFAQHLIRVESHGEVVVPLQSFSETGFPPEIMDKVCA